MSPKGLFRRMARAWSVLSERGVKEFFTRTIIKVRAGAGHHAAGHAAFLRRKQSVDQAFDRDTGVDTGGVDHLYDLTITSKNARFGTSHIASDPGEFAEAMASVDIDLAGATFIDMGSGKGRALLLATAYHFKQIIGVEFAAELHHLAEANMASLAATGKSDPRITLIHGDATTYPLPDGPLVLYFFNPFDSEVMRPIAEMVMTSWRDTPRLIRAVYVNPLHPQVWLGAGWVELAAGPAHAVYAPREG
jgi:SAM-dependent methyltransferase